MLEWKVQIEPKSYHHLKEGLRWAAYHLNLTVVVDILFVLCFFEEIQYGGGGLENYVFVKSMNEIDVGLTYILKH